MTIESGRMQVPTASPKPLMNVQHEVQKGLQDNDRNPTSAGSTNKQVAAANSASQRNVQQEAARQISKGHLDIKV